MCLVGSLEWRHGLALVLVQGRADDAPVAEVNLAMRLPLESQGVLHPVHVVSVGEVFPGVGATRFLPVGGRNGGLGADKKYEHVYQWILFHQWQLTRR